MHNTDIKQSLSDQSEQMKKLHGIVKKILSEEKLIVNNLLNSPKKLLLVNKVFLISLKAEIEIRNLHQKIDLLLEEQIKNTF